MIVGPVRAGERRDRLPDLLGDERHHRMQQPQVRFEHLHAASGACRASAPRVASSDCSAGFDSSRYQSQYSYQANSYSACAARSKRYSAKRARTSAIVAPRRERIQRSARRVLDGTALLSAVLAFRVHQHVARGVPQLVAEVLVAVDAAEIEADVAAHRRERAEREAQRIGAVAPECRSGNCLRVFFSMRSLQVRLHQAAGALGDQRLRGRCRRSGRAGR